jgi:predicted metal-dependent peptidase
MTDPNPFSALEEAARRQDAEERGLKAVRAARKRLILGRDARSAFFATLALRLELEASWGVETMATDGARLVVNPTFAAGLSDAACQGVLAHEVMHCALGHMARRGLWDQKRWNVACDLAVNPPLLEAGFELPACRLLPGEGAYQHLPPGLSAEEYYARLQEARGSGQADPGEGGVPDPGGCGGVRDAGGVGPAREARARAQWQVAVAQAAQAARQRGQLPAGLARVVEATLEPSVPWQEVLRAFVTRSAKSEYRWNRPNRRFVARGLYLPSLAGESLGEVVVAVDTSGSVGPRELARFAAELREIVDAYDVRLTILYHDSAVAHVQEWTPSDGPLVLEPRGGGGTSHVCVFEWIAGQGADPSCVVCLTDLYTDFPSPAPAVPVLWAVVGGCPARLPFGERIDLL